MIGTSIMIVLTAGILSLSHAVCDRQWKQLSMETVFYDSGISEVGTMEVYHKRYDVETGNPNVVIDIDLEWLQVDERFPGAAPINEYLAEEQKQHIAYAERWLEFGTHGTEGWPFRFSYASELSEIFYADQHYLSFYQSEYDYQGGLHEMLSRIGYAFDLQTGARLTLEDVIANSEEELKEIVTRYFGEAILSNPGYYWEDALDTVRERTDLEASFYLTEEGIRFYFGPYVLACFAAGFQEMTIPYEEFEMKISLESLGH